MFLRLLRVGGCFRRYPTEKHLNSMSAACCCTMLCKHVIKIETLYGFQVWTRPGFLLQPPLVVALCGSVCLQVWLQWVKGMHAVGFGSFIWTMKLSLFLKFRDHFIHNINKYWKWKHADHSYSAMFGRWCGVLWIMNYSFITCWCKLILISSVQRSLFHHCTRFF